jgi:POT family proton-dependent oligopeptide transporter
MSNSASRWSSFPKAAPYIIGTETAERFSFYGMKAILTTFLITQFFNPGNNPALSAGAEAHANEDTHFFVAMVYLTIDSGAYWPIMY